MDRHDLLRYLRSRTLAVEATVSPAGLPQAAVVGYVVSDRLELFFDTVQDSRKAQNLRHSPGVACVIGGTADGERWTIQYEGIADLPAGPELERLKALYFERFPDGIERQSWPGLIYVRVRPTWIRWSDFRSPPPTVVEFGPGDLA